MIAISKIPLYTQSMIKSEMFQESYCIFISEVTEQVKDYIKNSGIKGMKILKALFENKLYCIVIPSHHAFRQYESELFKIYRESIPNSGFWGQYAMGYKGKEWEVVE